MKRILSFAVLALTLLSVSSCFDIDDPYNPGISTNFTASQAVMFDCGAIGSDGAKDVELFISNGAIDDSGQLTSNGCLVVLSLNIPSDSQTLPADKEYTVAASGKYLPYSINLGETLANGRAGTFVAQKSESTGFLIPAYLATKASCTIKKYEDGTYNISGVCMCDDLSVGFSYEGKVEKKEIKE